MSSSEKFIKIPKIQIFQVLYHDVSYQSNRRWLCLFSKSNTITYLNISVTCHIGILRRWKDIFSVSDNPSFSPGPWTLKTVTLFHKTYISLVTYVREMKYQAQILGSLQEVPAGKLKQEEIPKNLPPGMKRTGYCCFWLLFFDPVLTNYQNFSKFVSSFRENGWFFFYHQK